MIDSTVVVWFCMLFCLVHYSGTAWCDGCCKGCVKSVFLVLCESVGLLLFGFGGWML